MRTAGTPLFRSVGTSFPRRRTFSADIPVLSPAMLRFWQGKPAVTISVSGGRQESNRTSECTAASGNLALSTALAAGSISTRRFVRNPARKKAVQTPPIPAKSPANAMLPNNSVWAIGRAAVGVGSGPSRTRTSWARARSCGPHIVDDEAHCTPRGQNACRPGPDGSAARTPKRFRPYAPVPSRRSLQSTHRQGLPAVPLVHRTSRERLYRMLPVLSDLDGTSLCREQPVRLKRRDGPDDPLPPACPGATSLITRATSNCCTGVVASTPNLRWCAGFSTRSAGPMMPTSRVHGSWNRLQARGSSSYKRHAASWLRAGGTACDFRPPRSHIASSLSNCMRMRSPMRVPTLGKP